jgi:cytochrome c oxidase subunit 1
VAQSWRSLSFDAYLHNTFFVVAHFHLIMGMAVSFALFAAIYYWFPLLTGKRMSERLGRWHFWLSLMGAYPVFFPMHFAGLAGEPRQYAQLTGTAAFLQNFLPLEKFITMAAFLLVATQFLFLCNVMHSWIRGEKSSPNPWDAETFEWESSENRKPLTPVQYRVVAVISCCRRLERSDGTFLAILASYQE